MTVDNSNNRTQLAVSGYDYDFTFKIFDDSQIKVYGVDADDELTLLTLTTDYTVEISEVSEGGTVQTVVDEVATEPSDYEYILMVRDVPFTQAADIPVRGGFNESVIEQALDLIVMQIQQIKDTIDYDEDQDPFSVASAAASADAAAASAVAAAASATAADVSEGIVSDVITAAIAAANHIVTGHDHDGADSKKVIATNLLMTGITSLDVLYNNAGTLAGKAMGRQIFTIAETGEKFTVPAGVTTVFLTLVAGGGGGGGGEDQVGEEGGGGGGGQAVIKYPVTVTPAEEITVTIGAKGAGGAHQADGANGGNSSFAAASGTITVLGGAKGLKGNGAGSGGAGGGSRDGGTPPACGTNGIPGGAGADRAGNVGGGGGASALGAGGVGVASLSETPGGDAVGYGGGGGGGPAFGTGSPGGGDGADGYCLVEW